MDEKNLVTEQVTENVETTTEETPKTFTQDEVNEIVGKAKARARARIEREFKTKYGNLENVLRAGTGKESVEEMTDTFTQFYQGKGIKIPNESDESNYSAKDIEVLAKAEAADIISAGYEDVVDEVDRLAELGFENMTAREKAYFKVLAEHRQNTERMNELSKIGVTDDVYNSNEFKEFASQFNSNTPVTKIFEIFNKTQPKKDIRTMGSMKQTPSDDKGIKDFYSFEEASKFTVDDFNKNPALYERVKESMLKW